MDGFKSMTHAHEGMSGLELIGWSLRTQGWGLAKRLGAWERMLRKKITHCFIQDTKDKGHGSNQPRVWPCMRTRAYPPQKEPSLTHGAPRKKSAFLLFSLDGWKATFSLFPLFQKCGQAWAKGCLHSLSLAFKAPISFPPRWVSKKKAFPHGNWLMDKALTINDCLHAWLLQEGPNYLHIFVSFFFIS